MTKEEIFAASTVILETKVGSCLYGTSTPESDVDYCGIFIAPPQYYIGFQTITEIDLSVVYKHESGKNTADAVDRKFYELRHFCKLALDGNPNIIEMLFSKEFETLTPEGQVLVDFRHDFLSNKISSRFLGYSFGQKKKMMIKTENYSILKEVLEVLGVEIDRGEFKFLSDLIYIYNTDKPEFYDKFFKGKTDKEFWNVSGIKVPKNLTIKKVYEMLSLHFNKFGSRSELITKHGYDTKFCSHCVRLLLEGRELLETGDLVLPLIQRSLILDIKKGNYSFEEILVFIDNLETEMKGIDSVLNKKPNTLKIEAAVMLMLSRHCNLLGVK